jgi:hypothetical protein
MMLIKSDNQNLLKIPFKTTKKHFLIWLSKLLILTLQDLF